MPTMNNPPPHLGWLELGLASTMMVLVMLLSAWLQLGAGKTIMIATVRTIVQLTVVGYILKPVFDADNIWLVLFVTWVMVMIAARQSYVTTSSHYGRLMFMDLVIAITIGVCIPMAFALMFVVKADRWWDPRYLIPMVGMLLGNSLKGMCVAIDTMVCQLSEQRARVESLLCMGATSWEAAHPAMRESVRLALMPQLNGMMIIGLVSIPGMMTGQIMGGTPPAQAARYQIIIMFLICAAVSVASILATVLAIRHLFSDRHCLLRHRIHARSHRRTDVVLWLWTSGKDFVIQRCCCCRHRRRQQQQYERVTNSL